MTNYEKSYKAFQKLLARKIYTVEAGLEELAAAHRVYDGYGQYDRKALKVWENAIDRWQHKWGNTAEYESICDKWGE